MKSYRLYRIILPIYQTEVEVIISDDFQNAYKDCGLPLPQNDPPSPSMQAFLQRYTCSNSSPGYALFLPSRVGAGTLAHEMLHCASHILQDRGIKFGRYNHEAYTYLLGYLVEQALIAYKMYRKDVKAEKKKLL